MHRILSSQMWIVDPDQGQVAEGCAWLMLAVNGLPESWWLIPYSVSCIFQYWWFQPLFESTRICLFFSIHIVRKIDYGQWTFGRVEVINLTYCLLDIVHIWMSKFVFHFWNDQQIFYFSLAQAWFEMSFTATNVRASTQHAPCEWVETDASGEVEQFRYANYI